MKSLNHENIVKLHDHFYEDLEEVMFDLTTAHFSQPYHGVHAVHPVVDNQGPHVHQDLHRERQGREVLLWDPEGTALPGSII